MNVPQGLKVERTLRNMERIRVTSRLETAFFVLSGPMEEIPLGSLGMVLVSFETDVV